jgi:hypothetical protein
MVSKVEEIDLNTKDAKVANLFAPETNVLTTTSANQQKPQYCSNTEYTKDSEIVLNRVIIYTKP